MSLMKSYLNVLNEDKASNFTSSGIADETKKQVGKAFGNEESEKNKAPEKNYGGEENVKSEVEEPVKGPHSENDSESLPHKLESVKNPFDLLFNKILSEEDMGGMEDGFEGSEDGESFDFNTSVEDQDETDGEEEGDEFETHEDEEESLHTVLDHLKSAVEALERLANHEAGESEEESDEDLDFGNEDEAEEVPVAEEATEMEELHPSEDLTQHSSMTVKGTTVTKKPSGKKAEVTKGVKPTGKWEPYNNKGETLQKKSSMDAKGVKANNTPLFEQ